MKEHPSIFRARLPASLFSPLARFLRDKRVTTVRVRRLPTWGTIAQELSTDEMNSLSATLVLADADIANREGLRDRLEEFGYLIYEVADGQSLLAQLDKEMPSLIVLDLQLPLMDGLDLCRRIKRFGDVPIVVWTALGDEETKLKALNLYAEDYILKPATLAEVVARVRRILRRTWLSLPAGSNTIEVDGNLSVDFLRREVRTPQGVSRLTPLESQLLQLLLCNSGQVLPTRLLLARLWGDGTAYANSLWEYIRRLRHKIGDSATRPRYILNEPGLGYRFSRLSEAHDGGD